MDPIIILFKLLQVAHEKTGLTLEIINLKNSLEVVKDRMENVSSASEKSQLSARAKQLAERLHRELNRKGDTDADDVMEWVEMLQKFRYIFFRVQL